jgi:hypothetical protein
MLEHDRPTPEEILHLKDSVLAQFDQLPPEHQASLGLVLTNRILAGNFGTWFLEALDILNLQQPLPDGFHLSEKERLFTRVSHERFMSYVADPRTSIHDAQLSTNNYGEFLFVTMSRPTEEEREQYTFFGLGYHEPRDRWISRMVLVSSKTV